MQNLMIFLFGLMVLLCIPPIFFFKSKAPTPPSFTASDVIDIVLIIVMCKS